MSTLTQKSVTVTGRMLDDTDREILRILQEDGRISTVDLAARIKLSPAACGVRLKGLVNDEVIVGYTVRVDARALDLGLIVFVTVELKDMSQKRFAAFTDGVKKTPEILECYMLARGAFLLMVRVKDMDAYREFIVRVIFKLPNVKEVDGQFVMEETKPFSPLPI